MRVTTHTNESCLKQVATSIVDSSSSANEAWLCVLDENRSWELAFDARSLTVQCCQNVWVFFLQNSAWIDGTWSDTETKNLFNVTGRWWIWIKLKANKRNKYFYFKWWVWWVWLLHKFLYKLEKLNAEISKKIQLNFQKVSKCHMVHILTAARVAQSIQSICKYNPYGLHCMCHNWNAHHMDWIVGRKLCWISKLQIGIHKKAVLPVQLQLNWNGHLNAKP